MSDRVSVWLESLGLDHYRDVFQQNAITWDVLSELTDEDLTSLGVLLGHRKKLLRAIAHLLQDSEGNHAAAQAVPAVEPFTLPSSSRGQAERRQLTIMFCDLVGSTALARRVDPEDLHQILRRFLDTCGQAIGQFHGYIAKYMGDGLLAYFGYPHAREHDAERAIHAGLVVLDLVKALPRDGQQEDNLAVRIGIATGHVLVGELIGEHTARERSVFGETPNLAARLQSMAGPNQLIVDATTRRLVGNEFECVDCGAVALKGFDRPVQSWQVVGRNVSVSRFESYRADRRAHFIGRESEIALLLSRWCEAVEGEGQVVLLSGEAGIGKSKLVRHLCELVREESHDTVQLQCSPHHANTVLYPVIHALRRAMGVIGEDSPINQLQTLQTFADTYGVSDQTTIAVLADLLSIPGGDEHSSLTISPDRRKELTLEALGQLLQNMADRCPTLCIVEDAHWIDPTTMEFLTRVMARIQRMRGLLLITARPDFTPKWSELNHVMFLTLGRLSRRQSAELLVSTTGGKVLPLEVEQAILAKTEGVPLYVEELTDSVIKSGLLIEETHGYRLKAPLKDLPVPDSLHALLIERIDRLGLAKEIAQIGAALGREFSYELLREVVDVAEGELQNALSVLAVSGLIVQEEEIPLARYVFRHALIQDAAYGILTKASRHTLHIRIAQAIENTFAERTADEPELLAHHYEQAESMGLAIKYWFLAAQRDVARSAHIEALYHLDKALELLGCVPQDSERDALELDLLVARGPVIISLKGYASDETEHNYHRVKELSQGSNNPEYYFFAMWGLWLFHLVRGPLVTAGDLADNLFSWAQYHRNQEFLIRAHTAQGTTCSFLGRLAEAKTHLVTAKAVLSSVGYTREKHRPLVLPYIAEPGIAARVMTARTLLISGEVDHVEALVQEALGMARKLEHPFTLAFALATVPWVYSILRDPRRTLSLAEESITLSKKYSFEVPLAYATFFHGWAIDEMGKDHGLGSILDGLSALRAAKACLNNTHMLALLAEVYLRKQRIDEGLGALEEALALVHSQGEACWHAELLRMKGELFLAQSGQLASAAEQCFVEAREIAQAQHATMLELRATVSLARLLRKQNKLDLAKRTLSLIRSRFGGQCANPDVMAAQALLDQLAVAS
ncbi:MAG TPA: adenylate/guanylate cyclase domain-containing protein [Nitrospira sp.]|nr:adenylate/guanylate cyclase domain-containing protein [Nitrospira sp.]